MEKYELHATELVKDVVPRDDLREMINIFMYDAGINMGSDFSDKTLDRVVQIVEDNFRFLPVCYVASAFKKGSLGQYGTGRLVPRTIYIWLNEITLEYNRDEDHKKLTTNTEYAHFNDLERYPLGRAIIKKIDWWKSGTITMDDWDRIPSKELAGRIGQGLNSVPELWGVTSKNKK